jgi:hypothetical protein
MRAVTGLSLTEDYFPPNHMTFSGCNSDTTAAAKRVTQLRAISKSGILPLVPYLDTLRWVFIAVALGGIAVTIYARIDDWKVGRR